MRRSFVNLHAADPETGFSTGPKNEGLQPVRRVRHLIVFAAFGDLRRATIRVQGSHTMRPLLFRPPATGRVYAAPTKRRKPWMPQSLPSQSGMMPEWRAKRVAIDLPGRGCSRISAHSPAFAMPAKPPGFGIVRATRENGFPASPGTERKGEEAISWNRARGRE